MARHFLIYGQLLLKRKFLTTFFVNWLCLISLWARIKKKFVNYFLIWLG
ncbi:hypothetical protein Syncc8109_2301 [Synechococcus sp. WH 8109]|nr:hypothetical protein Syncc8109_2301 [Synechococcus sp. WH 8109]